MTTERTAENLPWVEKYRPSTLTQIQGQTSTVTTIRKFVHEGKLPHLLFYGPPGTGKTSTILALAHEIYGPNYKNMVLELNASDDRGIDVVRNQIKNFASTQQIFARGFKLIILDEADAMTNVAQNALRRIIEKYTKNTRFCILANYAHKLNPALLSRCTRFRFSPLEESAIRAQLEKVIIKEHLSINEEAMSSLIKLSGGDMRRGLNVLQACKAATSGSGSTDSMDPVEVSRDMVYECIGAPHPADIETIFDSVLNDDWSTAIKTMMEIKRVKGLALIDLLQGFVEILGNYQLNSKARIHVLKKLAEIEYAISRGGNEKVQCSATIGVMKEAMLIQAGASQ
ncbi:hypothetical protein WICPIJ_002563 [Wickerhamomyces pijperi]|uniref:AAA+ ATPase domain-containing protein n=1 Tax=Wickerhamomyces pijperi TaxID=599730 RepID=A0A9P8QBG1_WICPI|nr:hypothetical protein WICPIJ_002563 [Wickerhamomyces pijperi]